MDERGRRGEDGGWRRGGLMERRKAGGYRG
jgi:hypothetical protein